MSAPTAVELLGALAERRGNGPAVCTTTLNLVAFIEDEGTLQRLGERIANFSRRHACRAIFLDCTGIEQRYSVRSDDSGVDGDTRHTQSEEIRIGARDLDPQQLRSIVHALLIPDIPTSMLWTGEHLAEPRFAELEPLARTIVVDSSRAAAGTGTIRELAAISDERAQRIRDLAYLRLLPWQDMIAQFFDDEDLLGELDRIAEVELATGSDAEAYYLAGWLASRLDWKPCGRNEFCNAAGTAISVRMRREGAPRHVIGVILRTGDTEFGARLDAKCSELVCLSVSGKHRRDERCAPLHDVDLATLVEQAMLAPSADPLYVETLSMVRALFDRAA